VRCSRFQGIQTSLEALFVEKNKCSETILEEVLHHCELVLVDLWIENRKCWRPVRESNPCRRREREAIYGNSKELSGMDSTLKYSKEL